MRGMEAGKFRRLTGVKPTVFEQMREAALAGEPASSHPAGGDRRGPKPKLRIEDRLLLLLAYLNLRLASGPPQVQLQRVTARLPSTSPAAPSRNAPVQTEPIPSG